MKRIFSELTPVDWFGIPAYFLILLAVKLFL